MSSREATDTLRSQVRNALRAAGMTQVSAAARLGLSQKHLSQMLTGRVQMRLDWAEQILNLCGQTLTLRSGPAREESATGDLPAGPALVYITADGRRIPVDREQITDRRERRLLRGLLAHAGELADKADASDDDPPKHPVGFKA